MMLRCPHCKNKISLRTVFAVPTIEGFPCPFCANGISVSLDPIRIYFGTLLMLFGLSRFDTQLLHMDLPIPGYGIYLVVSLLLIGMLSMRISPKMMAGDPLRDPRRLVKLASAVVLFIALVILPASAYMTRVPSKDSLERVTGTIVGLERSMKGEPLSVDVQSDTGTRTYVFYSSLTEWLEPAYFQPGIHVTLLAGESESITEDVYRVWEITSSTPTVTMTFFTYAATKKVRELAAAGILKENVVVLVVALILYTLASLVARRAEKVPHEESSS